MYVRNWFVAWRVIWTLAFVAEIKTSLKANEQCLLKRFMIYQRTPTRVHNLLQFKLIAVWNQPKQVKEKQCHN